MTISENTLEEKIDSIFVEFLGYLPYSEDDSIEVQAKHEAVKAIEDLFINLIRTEREEAIEKTEKKYAEIFSWLLGESGDFPRSEPGKRYGFRTELRQRLSLIGEKGADK